MEPLGWGFTLEREIMSSLTSETQLKRYVFQDGQLVLASLKSGSREWLDAPGRVGREGGCWEGGKVEASKLATTPVTEAWEGKTFASAHHRLQCFSKAGAFHHFIEGAPVETAAKGEAGAGPTGVEVDHHERDEGSGGDLLETWNLKPGHYRVRAFLCREQTDLHDNLARIESHQCWPMETLELRGCVFALEDVMSGEGWVLVKWAPHPDARPEPDTVDLRVKGCRLELLGFGSRSRHGAYPWSIAPFGGGESGAIAAIQKLHWIWREWDPTRDGLALGNTWGDRSRDAALNGAFVERELLTAQKRKLDVLQLDDGWQKGTTANSASVQETGGGPWEGFYESESDFWSVNRDRFPKGFREDYERFGIGCGLWFAPDSSHDFANWELDAASVLSMWRDQGARWVKVDAIKARSKAGERNLRRFFDKVLEESEGQVLFDLDVTAEVRPGFFGLPHVGPVFVENRYTDWGNYWPHHTFRNLWDLSHVVAPSRLRMEIANPDRNIEVYGDDPLSPAKVPLDYTFATVMVSSPLFWFELQHLSEERWGQCSDIYELWLKFRGELHQAIVLPIGEAPCGASWSGFHVKSFGSHVEHLLVFREPAAEDVGRVELKHEKGQDWVALYGDMEHKVEDGLFHGRSVSSFDVLWLRTEA